MHIKRCKWWPRDSKVVDSNPVKDEILSRASTYLNAAPNTGRETENQSCFFLICSEINQFKHTKMLQLTYNSSWRIKGVNRGVRKEIHVCIKKHP